MLCQLHLEPSVLGLSGRGADDFNVLEPQTDLSQTVVSMKPRQLGPVKLNRLIWEVSRRQTLWLHCNPLSNSLGNLWQSDTHKQWNLFVPILFYIGGHSHLFLAIRVLLPAVCTDTAESEGMKLDLFLHLNLRTRQFFPHRISFRSVIIHL